MVRTAVVPEIHVRLYIDSIAISSITWFDQVKYGHRLPRRPRLWPHYAAIDRSVPPRDLRITQLMIIPGVLADNSTSRFGRRRPYIMVGTLLCMVGMLLLGFTRPVASIFTSHGSSAVGSHSLKPLGPILNDPLE